MEQTLNLTLKESGLHHFFPLFQQGVIIKTQVGENIKDLLSHQLEITPEYVEKRIQTIFLDGKAVDNLGEAVVRDGIHPGPLRSHAGSGGRHPAPRRAFASLRRAITFSQGGETIPQKEGRIILKLFLASAGIRPPFIGQRNLAERRRPDLNPGKIKKGFLGRMPGGSTKKLPLEIQSAGFELRSQKDTLVLLPVTPIQLHDK